MLMPVPACRPGFVGHGRLSPRLGTSELPAKETRAESNRGSRRFRVRVRRAVLWLAHHGLDVRTAWLVWPFSWFVRSTRANLHLGRA